MEQSSHQIIAGLGLIGGGALTLDYFVHGPNSIIGKLFGHTSHFHHRGGGGVPLDPKFGRNKYGEPAGNRWVVPVPTMRRPVPLLKPDHSGRIYIKDDSYIRHGEAVENALWQVATMVFSDASYHEPSVKFQMGNTQHIYKKLRHTLRSPNAPEALKRVVEFHKRHGSHALNPTSVLYKEQLNLAGAAADAYERHQGFEKWFSREGFAYAGEYDNQNDRLSAAAAKSPLFFGIAGAYWNQ